MKRKTRDEPTISEITLLPDGRVYLFGLTKTLLEVVAEYPVFETNWNPAEIAGSLPTETDPASPVDLK